MARIGARQPAPDRQTLLIMRERAGELALRKKNFAGPLEADRHVPLALDKAGFGARQPTGDLQPLLEARECAREIVLRKKHAACPNEAAQQPCARRTTPVLFRLTDKSRWRSAWLGSALASRRA